MSGFGWDDTAQIVTAPDSVWEDLLKVCNHGPCLAKSCLNVVLRHVRSSRNGGKHPSLCTVPCIASSMAPLLQAMVHSMPDTIIHPLLQRHLTPTLRVTRKTNLSLILLYGHHKTLKQHRLSHPRCVFCVSCINTS